MRLQAGGNGGDHIGDLVPGAIIQHAAGFFQDDLGIFILPGQHLIHKCARIIPAQKGLALAVFEPMEIDIIL